MTENPEFDLERAHRFFSADCFNRAWDLIDKPTRTADEGRAMLRLGLTSLWHWTQRPDCTSTNLSIAYWQVSRIYALLKQTESAREYGELCLDVSQSADVLPFYLGYAYEALARAESVAPNPEKMKEYLKKAHQVSETMTDPEARKQLLDDLATIH
jgi:hypothetical protein